ncbi:MAG: ATP-binding protein [Aestuariivita sp.]|nr:ATP-binding protein [Aestuariivita sp.]MCY4201764.1 ATP-binding protein [Aestuariivita sp.]
MADIEGLQKFSELQERDEAMFFTGRIAYITHIQQAYKNAVTKQQANQPITSATRLFYGAPGAGKTSLLNEIEKRARRGDFGTPPPHVVSASNTALNKEKELVLTIAEHLEMDGVFRTIAQEQVGMGASILSILKGSIQTSQTLNPPEATFRHLKALYRALEYQPPILLCVDEIQNIKSTADEMLGVLHQGNHGLPIIPVYAGLGNSLNILMNYGVSRPVSDYIHSVGALANDEAQECVSTMLKAFNVDCTDVKEDWPSIISKWSDCWPQHLHNGMRALAKELICPDVNGVLRKVSFTNVSKRERTFRNKAYSWRISEMISECRILVGHIMHRIVTSSPTRLEAKQIIDDLHSHTPHKMPPEMTATQFLNHLIHRGLLQEFNQHDDPHLSPTGVVTCPIPSLATYVMQVGGIDPESQKDLQPSGLSEPSPFKDTDAYKIS